MFVFIHANPKERLILDWIVYTLGMVSV